MNLTNEEKTMYKVMKAIYDSGIPIDFKGSMVLKACLSEAGYSKEIRHTVDIDGNWYSENAPTGDQMVQSLEKALRKNGLELEVDLYRMYGEGRSAGFEIKDPKTSETLFTMDIDVNRPVASTKIYEVEGVRFSGVSPIQMLTDKISAISTNRVFRRIKDVVDLYYLSKVFEFDENMFYQALSETGRNLDNFDAFLNRREELEHSYNKFRLAGDVEKLPFEEVYNEVKNYIKDVIPRNRERDFER